IEALLDLPPMTDPEKRAAMHVLAGIYSAAFFTDTLLLYLHTAHMVNLSLEYGNCEASASAYAVFGFNLICGFGRYAEGYAFGKLGEGLAAREGFERYKSRVSFMMELISFWTQPIDVPIAYMTAGLALAIETHDVPVACYCSSHLVINKL